jgi:exo-beta-1,3-glucanase (GH17 family)
MKSKFNPYFIYILVLSFFVSCTSKKGVQSNTDEVTAEQILGNPNYQAMCYGGYRAKTRDVQPTIAQLKEDMKILSAMNIKVLRTYQTKLPQDANVVKAISELKKENPKFEMYVMLGVWINCKNAFTDKPDHYDEDEIENKAEILRAIDIAKTYPDIVKIVAVGNEAMVKWAGGYHVQSGVILKWDNYLQNLKKQGQLSKNLWITSSDNFASWGGEGKEYHKPDLEKLINAVDYISIHTYPMHDTHYNPNFWGIAEQEKNLSDKEKIEAAMKRAQAYAINQHESVKKYIKSLGIQKPIHIGETGWASSSDGFYGVEGTKATDEYKEALYYQLMQEFSKKEKVSCFFFEAFNEPWKDAKNPNGPENHFGLFTLDGKAKYAVWKLVDEGVFNGLKRDGNPITKTFNGDENMMMKSVSVPSHNQTLK